MKCVGDMFLVGCLIWSLGPTSREFMPTKDILRAITFHVCLPIATRQIRIRAASSNHKRLQTTSAGRCANLCSLGNGGGG